jgi:crotonobetainyl-CoA:carnitine CoA-transferase CaiB-like acyl-CoA transferase
MSNTESIRSGALARYRVLELGSLVAGPFCGSFFADFGAEVIKVEQPEGDPVRAMGDRIGSKSLYAASMMRNKRLISVDLGTPEGQEIVRSLVRRCDVVIENFRPGVLERWGLNYEALRALNPLLIMVRVSGFGQDGPYASRPGYGVIGEAVSGLRHLIGDADRPPARAALPLTDYVAGMYAAMGALVALSHRDHTGQGQCVDASLFESAFSFLRSEVPSFDKLGKVAKRAGARLPGHVPSNLYETRDGGYIHISAGNNSLFRRLVRTMGRPELAEDPRFSDPVERARHEDEIDRMIASWVISQELDVVEKTLIDAEVVASRIFTVEDIFRDPHFAARAMLPDVPDDELGTLKMPGVVPKLSRTPGNIRSAGGANGRDTFEVLLEHTAMSLEQIRTLESRGVLRQSAGRAAEGQGAGHEAAPSGAAL